MFMNILKGVFVALAGILLLLFPTESLYTITIYLGIAMVCYGAFTIIAFFVSRSKDNTEQSEKSKNQGKIVGGYTGYADNLSAGKKSAFDISSFASDLPAHDSVEVVAQGWM